MSDSFADRLIEAIRKRAVPAVIALDPVAECLPAGLSGESPLERMRNFSRTVIQRIAPVVPAVKINIAFFEPYGASGIQVYQDLVREAADCGLIVIGDVKRGDVGHTAELYAKAHLGERSEVGGSRLCGPDAITVNGYFGFDGVAPFIRAAREHGKGVFVLVRTSNPSAAEFQDQIARDGRRLHEHLASRVAIWAAESGTVGRNGYSAVGAVTASRDPADAARLREIMPLSILLVPGYGAQGGSAEDFRPYFKADGSGAIIAAGRFVIYAHERPEYGGRFGDDWQRCVEQACTDFVADLRCNVAAK